MKKFIFLLLCSTSVHAVDMNCLKKENGKCVSVNDVMVRGLFDGLAGVPKAAAEMLSTANDELSKRMATKPTELKPVHSMEECVKKQNGKHVIDNAAIHCRYGRQ